MTSSGVVGGLSHRITLQQPTRIDDGGGGASITYVVVARVWAEVASKSAGERAEHDDLAGRRKHSVRIRRRTDVRPGWRVNFDGRDLRIRGVVNPNADKRWLHLDCEEEVR